MHHGALGHAGNPLCTTDAGEAATVAVASRISTWTNLVHSASAEGADTIGHGPLAVIASRS